MRFEPGETVGDYRILEELGSGGVGRVFKVEHKITRRREAMKVLLHGRPSEQEAQRFLREIQVQARLNHPNIAAVHNAFWVEDDLVMVMELLDGDSLRKLLDTRKVSLKHGIDILHQALAALSYAHANGVVHRDVAPANIIITSNGLVKLTDFGLARTDSDLHLTKTGTVVGSLYYMSPEQVRGLEEIDARTDIYSCGVVLYEICTGKKPFDSDNAFSLMQAHVGQAPVAPVERVPHLPSALNNVILRALAKEPSDRFQSADEFREALERVLSTGVERRPRPATPVKVVVLSACGSLALIVLSVLLGGMWWQASVKSVTPLPNVEAVTEHLEAVVPAPAVAEAVTMPPEEISVPQPSQKAEPIQTVRIGASEPALTQPKQSSPAPKPVPAAKRHVTSATQLVKTAEPPAVDAAPAAASTISSEDIADELPSPDTEPQPGAEDKTEEKPNRLFRFLGKAKILNPLKLKDVLSKDEEANSSDH
jgi:serine/threonine protein kinase